MAILSQKMFALELYLITKSLLCILCNLFSLKGSRLNVKNKLNVEYFPLQYKHKIVLNVNNARGVPHNCNLMWVQN